MTVAVERTDPGKPRRTDRWSRIRRLLASDAFVELVRYGLCSALALAVDVTLLIALTELAGMHFLMSAAIGFTAGLLLIYVLSISFVFQTRSLEQRWIEFATFALIGIVGLGVNQVMLAALTGYAGLPYQIAKLPTVFVVFGFNFVARRSLLFAARRCEA